MHLRKILHTCTGMHHALICSLDSAMKRMAPDFELCRIDSSCDATCIIVRDRASVAGSAVYMVVKQTTGPTLTLCRKSWLISCDNASNEIDHQRCRSAAMAVLYDAKQLTISH